MTDRGTLINRKASLGREIVQLKEQIPEVAKQARKTPAKTMVFQLIKVEQAKGMLPILERRLERLELELVDVTRELDGLPVPPPRCMKVYIVERCYDHEGGQIEAVFSTEAAAEAYVEANDGWPGYLEWVEYQVDSK